MTDIDTRRQLYAQSTILLPKMLPDRIKLAGIDDLFIGMGGKKEWLDKKDGPRLWETDKAQRIRAWLDAFNAYDSVRLFPVILECLNVLASANPQLFESDAKAVNRLAERIKLATGISTTPPPQQSPLDPRLWGVVQPQWQAGDYANAVRQAYVELIAEVKRKAGTPSSLDGEDLMNKTFSESKPILRVSTDGDIQRGTMNLFKGVIAAIRNPVSHSNQVAMTYQEATELLWLANYLLRLVDNSIKEAPVPGRS